MLLVRIRLLLAILFGDALLAQFDQVADVVELGLLQYTFLGQVLVDDQLAVTQVVQHGTEVRRVAINQVRTVLVLDIEVTVTLRSPCLPHPQLTLSVSSDESS